MILMIPTEISRTPANAAQSVLVGKLRAYCHANNLRRHPKREMIVETLQSLAQGATADYLWELIYQRGPKISFAGLYYSLNWLIAAGFVEKQGQGKQMTVYRARL